MSGTAVKRLAQELRAFEQDPLEGVRVELGDDGNMFRWDVSVFGPPDTIYAGGFFKVRVPSRVQLDVSAHHVSTIYASPNIPPAHIPHIPPSIPYYSPAHPPASYSPPLPPIPFHPSPSTHLSIHQLPKPVPPWGDMVRAICMLLLLLCRLSGLTGTHG